jgi:hypothetical protein
MELGITDQHLGACANCLFGPFREHNWRSLFIADDLQSVFYNLDSSRSEIGCAGSIGYQQSFRPLNEHSSPLVLPCGNGGAANRPRRTEAQSAKIANSAGILTKSGAPSNPATHYDPTAQ